MSSKSSQSKERSHGSQLRIEIYTDKRNEFRWRAIHQNGRIMADSGEGYKSKSGILKALSRIRHDIKTATVVEK